MCSYVCMHESTHGTCVCASMNPHVAHVCACVNRQMAHMCVHVPTYGVCVCICMHVSCIRSRSFQHDVGEICSQMYPPDSYMAHICHTSCIVLFSYLLVCLPLMSPLSDIFGREQWLLGENLWKYGGWCFKWAFQTSIMFLLFLLSQILWRE